MGSKKLNIAIFIVFSLESGGGFQYEFMVLNILKNLTEKNNEIFNINYYSNNRRVQEDYKELNIDIKIINENQLQKYHRLVLSNLFFYKLLEKVGLRFSKIENKLHADNVDLVYFLYPSILTQSLVNIPYIFTLWDVGHLQNMEFPEVSYDKKFELRESLYTKSLKKSFKITVDSIFGKKYIVNKYNLDDERVEVLKFLPNIRINEVEEYVSIKDKYKLKNDYIFYPAQFWAHKNHLYILKAIKILREEKHMDIDVIFSGSNKGNLEYILNKAKEFKINDLIHFIGFVPNEEIPFLYKQSLALVMPTYLGPTNIPPLEAFAYKTVVCYSDIAFFREQVEDAAFFMDLKNPNSLVEHILTIRNDKKTVEEKKEKGAQILQAWNKEDFESKLLGIFNEYKYIRELWK